MPDEPEVSIVPRRKVNERTEAKFLEDADKMIAEAVRQGAAYTPPNPFAALPAMQAKRTAVHAARTADQVNNGAEEVVRNARENLYKSLQSDVRSLVDYAKSSGKSPNDIAALNTLARELGGRRAGAKDENSISVSHMSYASRADKYAEVIEQYDALGIETDEDMYKADTHRARLAAIRQANQAVITAAANSQTSGELYDRLAYTDADSLMNSCISSKNYIKSKYKNGEPYQNIAKTRFSLPSRLR